MNTKSTYANLYKEAENYLQGLLREDVDVIIAAREAVDAALSKSCPGEDFSCEVGGAFTLTGNPICFTLDNPHPICPTTPTAAVEALKQSGYDATQEISGRFFIVGLAPDCADYGGNTEPGSDWDDECDQLAAEIREIVAPFCCDVEWRDDDLMIIDEGGDSRLNV